MFTSAILDLRLESRDGQPSAALGDREPGRLTAEAFRWPVSAPERAIRELGRAWPRSVAEGGALVVILANVDATTGSDQAAAVSP